MVGGLWLVGWWLVVPLVGLLLVLGGWWVHFGLQSCFQLLGTTPWNLGRRWLGVGGGKLWLGWWVVGSVVGRLGRKPRFSLGFSRFLGGRTNMSPTPPLFGLPASRLVFLRFLVENVIFVEARA